MWRHGRSAARVRRRAGLPVRGESRHGARRRRASSRRLGTGRRSGGGAPPRAGHAACRSTPRSCTREAAGRAAPESASRRRRSPPSRRRAAGRTRRRGRCDRPGAALRAAPPAARPVTDSSPSSQPGRDPVFVVDAGRVRLEDDLDAHGYAVAASCPQAAAMSRPRVSRIGRREPRRVEHRLERRDPLARRAVVHPGRVVRDQVHLEDVRSSSSASAAACSRESLTPASITYSTNTLRRRSSK